MSALVADDERASRQATGRAGLNVGRASHEMGFQLELRDGNCLLLPTCALCVWVCWTDWNAAVPCDRTSTVHRVWLRSRWKYLPAPARWGATASPATHIT